MGIVRVERESMMGILLEIYDSLSLSTFIVDHPVYTLRSGTGECQEVPIRTIKSFFRLRSAHMTKVLTVDKRSTKAEKSKHLGEGGGRWPLHTGISAYVNTIDSPPVVSQFTFFGLGKRKKAKKAAKPIFRKSDPVCYPFHQKFVCNFEKFNIFPMN
jgi:hypothetical protein